MNWELAVAVLAAVAWGTSDFLAGAAARRLPVRTILAGSKAAGATLAILYLLIRPEPLPHNPHTVLVSAAAGLLGVPAMGLLYRAMRDGSLAIVAPVAAGSALIPAAWGVAHGEHLGDFGLIGAAAALLGMTLAGWPTPVPPRPPSMARSPSMARPPSMTRSRSRPRSSEAAMCAAGAMLGFGTYFVLLHEAAPQDPYSATACARIAGGLTVLLYLLARSARRAAARAQTPPSRQLSAHRKAGPGHELVPLRRPQISLPVAIALLTALIGVLDAVADGAFAVAAAGGALGTAAILGSLYPAVTVTLNVALLGERLPRLHLIGVLSALFAVACLAL